MQCEVRKMVLECSCAASKQRITVVATLKPTPIPLKAFDLVAIDLMSLPKSHQGNCYIVAAQDYFSKWPEAKAVPKKTAQAVAEFLEEYVFARWGCPLEVISDQGREFLGEVNQLLQRGRVIHRITSAYRAQANGMIEHLNGVMGRALEASLEQGDIRTWERGLNDFLAGYRGLWHASTRKNPYQLLFAKPMRLAWKFQAMPRTPTPDDLGPDAMEAHMKKLLASLRVLQDSARESILKQQVKNMRD